MKQIEENYVSMCLAVRDVLAKHESVWETNVPFGTLVTQFRELIDAAASAMEGAEVVSTGATADKEAAELIRDLSKKEKILSCC